MKSLSDNYKAAHGSTHETFADLIFCALVVLVLFVLALAVEVSQRVRAEAIPPPVVEEVKAEEVATMTPEEIEELSKKIREQSNEIEKLQAKMKEGRKEIKSQMAALSGEQRFTGAREPAALHLAYNYKTHRYYFIPSKLLKHADTQQSGESFLEFNSRKTDEFIEIALKARRSRGYTLGEITSIYSSLSQYQEVVASSSGYKLQNDQVGILYYVHLCEYIAGDAESRTDHKPIVVAAMLSFYEKVGPESEGMYPIAKCTVNERRKTISIGGVELSSNQFRVMLIAFTGRGVVLDFQGYDGRVPKWLYDQSLMPSGYVSKTPKLPTL